MKKSNITVFLSIIFVSLFYLALWIEGFSALYLMILVIIIGLILIVFTIRDFIKKNFHYSLIGIFALFIVIFRPIEIALEYFKSPIIISGYCEHTVSRVALNLRADKSFDYNAGGFLKREIYFGIYSVKNDTLILEFEKPNSKNTNDTLVYKNGWLSEIKKTEHKHNFKLTTNSLWK